jgi:D-glycero-alpha-D-manno-heptose-7-phosphate kinase
VKRKLSSKISNSAIDDLYEQALKNGALGGKLCGAGGGGFLLLVVPPENQVRFKEKFSSAQVIPIGLDPLGSQIIQM